MRIYLRFILSGGFALSQLLFMGCFHQENTSKATGFIDNSNASLWKDTIIPVCWENATYINSEGQTVSITNRKKSIQDVVLAEYNKTIIRFSGWGTCAEKSLGIRIRFGLERPSVKGLGAIINGLPAGMEISEADTCGGQLPLESCILYNALHEFGHALGLRHEQERVVSCDNPVDQDNPMGIPIGGYDENSIMNYCLKYGGRTSHPTLSPQDIETIRLAYTQYHQSMSQPPSAKTCDLWKLNFNPATNLCTYKHAEPEDCHSFAQVLDSLTFQCRLATSAAECRTIPATYGAFWSAVNGCTTVPD